MATVHGPGWWRRKYRSRWSDWTKTRETPSFSEDQLRYYGTPIPIGMGSRLVEGKLIWSDDIRHSTRTKLKTVNAGAKKDVHRLNFAVAFGYSGTPAEDREAVFFKRIWFEETLIYDNTPGAVVQRAPFGKLILYNGSEDQFPDDRIDKREDFAVGFRGMVYAVFVGFNPEKWDFGQTGSIPKVTAEIVDSSSVINELRTYTSISSGLPNTSVSSVLAVDWELQEAIGISLDANDEHYFRFYDIYNWIERPPKRIIPRAGQTPYSTTSVLSAADSFWNYVPEYRLIITTQGANNSSPIVSISLEDGKTKDVFGSPSSSFVNTTTRFVFCDTGCMLNTAKRGKPQIYLFCGGTFGDQVGILRVKKNGTLTYMWGADQEVPEGLRGIYKGHTIGKPSDDDPNTVSATAYVATGNKIGRVLLKPGREDQLYYGQLTVDYEYYELGANEYCTYILSWQLDKDEDGVDQTYLIAWIYNTVTEQTRLAKFIDNAGVFIEGRTIGPDVGTLQEIWSIADVAAVDSTFAPAMQYSRLDAEFVGYYSGTTWCKADIRGYFPRDTQRRYLEVSAAIGTNEDGTTTALGIGYAQAYDSVNNSIARTNTNVSLGQCMVWPQRGQTGEVPLSDLLSFMAQYAGYDADDIEITGITDTVTGALVTNRENLFDLFDRMGRVFLYDYFESEGKIKIVKRDFGSSLTKDIEVTAEELAFIDEDDGPVLNSVFTDSEEMPDAMELYFLNPSAKYTVDVVYQKRTKIPVTTQTGGVVDRVDIPIVMTRAKAQYYVTAAIYLAWESRLSHEFRLPPKWLKVEPTDIVEITTSEQIFLMQIVEAVTNADKSTSVSARGVSAEDFDSEFVNPTLGPPERPIPGYSHSIIALLDTPILNPADYPTADPDFITYYDVLSYGQPGWTWASVQESLDDSAWTELTRDTSLPPFGIVTSALAAPNDVFSVDEANTMTVVMLAGEMSDALYDNEDLFNGQNFALIGAPGRWELIQFRDVTLNSDGSYTLSGFTRGRRGTDVNVGSHETNDKFIILEDITRVRSFTHPISALDETRYFRAVGAFTDSRDPISEEVVLEGNVLKPWAPVNVAAALEYGDDVQITWQRRNRLIDDGYPDDGPEESPLFEDTEEYEVDILDGPGGSVVRSVTGLDNPSFLYTDAMQTADGFSAPVSSLTVKVYQISATVGRGFTKEVTIDVV